MAGNTSQPGASVLARAVALLACFDEDSPTLGLGELVQRSGLATTTVHRIAGELLALGLLERDDRRRYSIGTRLWELGELSEVSLLLREQALPHLLELYEATGENVHLAVLSGNEALYVARLIGPRSVPTVSRMGGRLPLHTTGVGKVLLASQDDAFVDGYLAAPLAGPTVYSIRSPERLREDVRRIREQDYAITSQEMTLGNISVAVPLRGPDGRVFAALGFVAHTIKGEPSRLVPRLRRAADGIARDMDAQSFR